MAVASPALPTARAAPDTDLLRWPVVGAVLRWRHLRTAMQCVLAAVALVIVVHGLFGPQLAPTNLATVLTWVHYRGLLIGVLLLAGNLFCAACPLVLVRNLVRRVRPPVRAWPRRRPVRLRAVRPVGAAGRDRLARHRILRGRPPRRRPVPGRRLLLLRLPGGAVQLRRLHAVAIRDSGTRCRHVRDVPDG